MKFESELAESVFRSKYLLEGETEPNQAVERIVKSVSKVYPEIEEEAREYINKQWFIPAGGVWRASGNPVTNVSHINCTTLTPVEDSLESIFESLYKWAKVAALGQGVGIDISLLRPKGAKVHNSSRESTGAVSFMHLYDAVLKVIAQQGRRGASLISIRDNHPDLEDFITIKDKAESDKSRIDTANISIQTTNNFINSVLNNEDWELKFSNKYENISRIVKAKDLWNSIIHMAWKRGDPGLQFIDIAKANSNSDALGYPIVSTNAPVTGSSLVLTKKGLFPIKELYESNKELSILYDPIVEKEVSELKQKSLNNISDPYFKKAYFKKYENQNVIEIELKGYPSLFCNKEHKWFTSKGYKQTSDLKFGDEILISRKSFVDYLDENKIIIDTSSKEYKEAFLCGWLTGDGWLGNNYKGDTKTEHKNIGFVWRKGYDDILSILKEVYFDITGNEINYIRDRGTSLYARVSSYKFYNYMKNTYGYVDNKYIIPKQAFSSYTFAVGFLRGLFQTDGFIDKLENVSHRICLTSSNKDIIDGVSKLLLNWFGIKVGVVKRKNQKGVPYTLASGEKKISKFKEGWILSISSKGFIKKFLTFIGFTYGDKKQISNQYLTSNTLDINESRSNKFYTYTVLDIKDTNRKEDMYCGVVPDGESLIIEGFISSNCSELWLDPENVCNLSQIKIAKFVEYGWEGYKKLIRFGIKFLNAIRINEIKENRSPTEAQKNKIQLLPRTGLGVTGLADLLMEEKIEYGSDESIKVAYNIFSTLAQYSYITGYELGKAYGSYPAYDKIKIRSSSFIQRMLKEGLLEDYHLDYQFNVTYNAIAPVGTGALISNNGGSGIEPIFSKYMVRRERSTTKEWKEWFTFNPYIERWMKNNNIEVTRENADSLNESWFKPSYSVNNFDKLKLVSEIQKWIDSSISVTFNLPENATEEEVSNIYLEAWKKELKGITVYREGSLTGVLITEQNYNKQQQEKLEGNIEKHNAPKRPKDLPCDIHSMKVKEEYFLVLIGLYNNEPYEVFVTNTDIDTYNTFKYKKGILRKEAKGKYNLLVQNGVEKIAIENIGKVFNSDYETLTRLISTSLRHGTPLSFLCDQLSKDKNFASFGKVISRVLKQYIKNGEKVLTSKVCPNCGGNNLIYQDGCVSCLDCGNSKCS